MHCLVRFAVYEYSFSYWMIIMHISFEKLWQNYPGEEEFNHDALFDYLGWSDLKRKYRNTCAIRMSLCLLRSGVPVRGRFRINRGPLEGKMIEPGQDKLSKYLDNILNPSVKMTKENRDELMKGRNGIISFMQIPGYDVDGHLGGHIDLVKHGKFLMVFDTLDCAGSCDWQAKNYWFWPL